MMQEELSSSQDIKVRFVVLKASTEVSEGLVVGRCWPIQVGKLLKQIHSLAQDKSEARV